MVSVRSIVGACETSFSKRPLVPVAVKNLNRQYREQVGNLVRGVFIGGLSRWCVFVPAIDGDGIEKGCHKFTTVIGGRAIDGMAWYGKQILGNLDGIDTDLMDYG